MESEKESTSGWKRLRRGIADALSGGYVRELEEENARLENSNIRDGLTGLFNKQEFFKVLDQLTPRANTARYETDASSRPYVLVMDLDNFSAYNAVNGHSKGDEMLRIAGQYINERFALKDMKARFGGDEFAAICYDVVLDPPTFISGLEERVETFDQVIKTLNPDGMVRLSIGAAELTPRSTGREIFERADLALYHVKHDKHLLKRDSDVQLWKPGVDYARIQKAYSAFKKK